MLLTFLYKIFNQLVFKFLLMRKQSLLMLFFIVSFLFLGGGFLHSQTVVFEENFNSMDGSVDVPSGWDSSDFTVAQNEKWRFFNDASKNYDGACLRFNSYNSSTGEYSVLKTPAFDITKPVELSFMFNNPRGGEMILYIDNTVIDTLRNTTKWTEYVYSLNSFINRTGVRVVFKSISNDGSGDAYHYLDNVKVAEPPTCKKPVSLIASEVTSSSASFFWDLDSRGNEPNGYLVTLRDVNSGNYILRDSLISAAFKLFSVSGLSANTTYSITLRSDCSNGGYGYSDYSTFYTFTTLCTPTVFPFENNFDSEGGDIPSCWVIPSGFNQNTRLQSAITSTGKGKALFVDAENATGVITTNTFVAKSDSIQVNFKYYAESSASIEVGIAKSPYDFTDLFIIGSVNISAFNSWVPARFNSSILSQFPDYGDTVCVVLRTSSNGVYVDDFSVEKNEGCPRLENVIVSDIRYNSAVIGWDEEFIPTGNYIARITANGKTTSYVKFTEVPYTLNLKEHTDYTVEVASLCADGDTSEWSLPVSFSTLCFVSGGSYFEGFDDYSSIKDVDCWTFAQTKNGSGSGSDRGAACWSLNSSSSYIANKTKKSLKANYGKAGGRYIAASPAMNIPAENAYEVGFFMYRKSATSPKKNECVNVWVNTSADTVGGVKIATISTYTSGSPVVEEDGMYEYYYKIPMSGDVHIIFEYCTQNGTAAYLDEISVYASPTCRKVKDIVLGSTTTNSAAISWTRGENETQYLVKYRYISKYNDLQSDTVYVEEPQLVNGTSYVIPNLPAGDILNVKGSVASYCGAGDTSVWVDFDFANVYTKAEPAEMPFAEDFNRVSSSLFPPAGWSRAVVKEKSGTSSSNYGVESWVGASTTSSSSSNYNVPGGAQFKKCNAGNRVLLSTPALIFDANKKYQVVFTMYRHTSKKADEGIRILVGSNAEDTLNAVVAGFYNAYYLYAPAEKKSGKYEYTLELPANIGGTQYVLFEGISNYGAIFYLDDVYVEEVPACKRLKDFEVEALSNNSALVTILDTAWHESSWQACFGDPGFNPDESTLIFTSATSADSTITATGLQSDHNYEVYIRRYCSAESQSPWSRVSQRVRTHCDAVAIDAQNDFVEGFESRFVVKSTNTDTVGGCFFQKYQREKSTYSSGYIYCVENRSVSSAPFVDMQPYKGNRFAYNEYDYHNWTYRHFHLEAGKQYKMQVFACIGRVVEDDDTQGAYFAMAYSTEADTAEFRKNVFCSSFVNTTSWVPVSGYFTVPATGDYYLALYSYGSKASSGNIYGYGIDELSVSEISCVPPLDVKATATTDSATISYTFIADSVEVRVASFEFDKYYPQSDVYRGVLNTTGLKIGNLQPNTDYWYAVRSFCGEKPSEWSNVYTFRTGCEAVALPIQENFESKSDLSCWRTLGYTSGSTFKVSTEQQKVGQRSCMVSGVTIISPMIDVASLANVTISGYAYSDDEDFSFDIGIINDPTDVLTYESVKSVTLSNTGEWNQFNADFTVLSTEDYADFANAKYIAIVVETGKTCYFDDIIISEASSCPMPTDFRVLNVENDNVRLSWTAGGTETEWHLRGLRYLADNSDVIVDVDTIVNTNDVTIGGLFASSDYMFEVTARCSASSSSYVAYSNNFTTYCEPYNTSYELDVNDFYKNNSSYQKSLPECWTNVSYPETRYNGWNYKTESSGSTPPITNYRIEFNSQSANTKGNMAQLMSPIFDLTGVDTTKNETAKVLCTIENYAADTVFICVSTDFGKTIADTLAEVVYTTTSSDWNFDREIDLKKFAGQKVRIIFQTTSTGGARADLGSLINKSARARLKNFELRFVDPCVMPTSIGIDSCKSNYVKAYITDSINSNMTWEYAVVESGYKVSAATPVAFSTDSHLSYSQHIPFTITGLLPSKDYDVYVRTTCGGGSASKWFGPTGFRTGCADVLGIPYHENFETLTSKSLIESNGCFSFYTPAPETNVYPSYSYGSQFYSAEGKYSLELNSSNEYPFFMILPKFDTPSNELQMTFAYRYHSKVSGDGPIEVGLMADPSMPETFVKVAEFESSTAVKYETVLFSTLGAGYDNYYIAFKYGATTKNNCTVYLDDITVDYAPECSDVQRMEITDITTNSVTAKFYYNADTLQVAYGAEGADVSACTVINTTDNVVTINGLNKSAAYYIYYRTICNGEATEWSEPMFVNTGCDVISVPRGSAWDENFDAYSAMAYPFPNCFERVLTTSDKSGVYPVIVNEPLASKPASLMLRGENIVALPQFDLDLSAMVVDFNYQGTGDIIVGVQTDLRDESAFVALEELVAKDNILNAIVDFSKYNVSGGRVALRSTSNSTIYIDDLEVRWSDNLCFAPRNLQVYNVTDTMVTLEWEVAHDAVSFDYKLFKSADNSEVASGNTTTNTDRIIIRSLEPSTSYYFITRANCFNGTDNSVSAWDTISFTTTSSDYVSVPFYTYFESDDENAGWHFVNGELGRAQKNKFVIGTAEDAVRTGTKALYITDGKNSNRFYYNEDAASDVYVYRYINFSEPGTYDISYDWRCEGRGAVACSRAFLAPIDTTFKAGDLLIASGTTLPENTIKLYNSTNLSGENLWKTETYKVNVEKAGTYKFVISWHNATSSSSNSVYQPPFTIDRLFIEKHHCDVLRSVTVTDRTTNSLTFKSTSTIESAVEYNMYNVNDLGTPVASDELNSSETTVTGLAAGNEYILLVSQNCKDNSNNTSTKVIFASTLCDADAVTADNVFVDDFEDLYEGMTPSNCWYQTELSPTARPSQSEWQCISNSYRSPYSGSGFMSISYGNHSALTRKFALVQDTVYRIQAYVKGYNDYDDVNFGYLDNDGFHTLAAFNVDKDYKTYYCDFKAPATADYQLGFMVNMLESTVNYISIDSVVVSTTNVMKPNVFVEQTDNHCARISWKGNSTSYRLKIVDNESKAAIKDTTLVANELEYCGFDYATPYTISVRGGVNADTTDWGSVTLKMDCGVYRMPYRYLGESHKCWETQDEIKTGSSSWSFGTDETNGITLSTLSKTGHFMAVSPAIEVPDSNAFVSFKYFNYSELSTMMVSVISDDATVCDTLFTVSGKTVADGYNPVYLNFSKQFNRFAGKNVRVRISTRINRSDNMGSTTSGRMGIFDLRVSRGHFLPEYYDTICGNENYNSFGFDIKNSDMTLGHNKFTVTKETNEEGQADTIKVLNLYLGSVYSSEIFDTICSGDTYSFAGHVYDETGRYTENFVSHSGCDSTIVLYLTVDDASVKEKKYICEGTTYNFNGTPLTVSGTYVDTIVNARGCTAVNTLELVVIPTYFTETAYFCEGNTYTWHGNTYNVPGRYTANYTNHLGCDSIHVLNLIEIPANVDTTITICQGDSYLFGGENLTVAGTYTHQFANSLNCDSVVNLTLVVTDAPRNVIEDYICEGYGYYGYGFNIESVTQDTVAERVISRPSGCDSILEIHLTFHPTDTVRISATINEGEIYDFGGSSYTTPGEYTYTTVSSLGCDSVTILTLDVVSGTDDSYLIPITVAPNPIRGGESTYLVKEWTEAEKSGMIVEVFNAVGQRLMMFRPTVYPITIDGIFTAGVYNVRVISGTGEVYIGKLIVK